MPVEAYYRPTELDEALALTDEHRTDLEVVSGGTMTMPAINEGHLVPERVLDLRELGLDYLESNGDGVTLGATVTLSDVTERVDVPLLATAAKHSGSWAVRNTATVGGNLFAPPPLGDVAVAALALDASVELTSQAGDRTVPLTEFYVGADERALDDDELVTALSVPTAGAETAFRKQTRNQEPAPSIVTVAANLELAGDTVESARIALNGAGPHPVRSSAAESVLEGASLDEGTIEAAAAAAAEAADPFTDAIASEWYRTKMIERQLERTLAAIAEDTT